MKTAAVYLLAVLACLLAIPLGMLCFVFGFGPGFMESRVRVMARPAARSCGRVTIARDRQ